MSDVRDDGLMFLPAAPPQLCLALCLGVVCPARAFSLLGTVPMSLRRILLDGSHRTPTRFTVEAGSPMTPPNLGVVSARFSASFQRLVSARHSCVAHAVASVVGSGLLVPARDAGAPLDATERPGAPRGWCGGPHAVLMAVGRRCLDVCVSRRSAHVKQAKLRVVVAKAVTGGHGMYLEAAALSRHILIARWSALGLVVGLRQATWIVPSVFEELAPQNTKCFVRLGLTAEHKRVERTLRCLLMGVPTYLVVYVLT